MKLMNGENHSVVSEFFLLGLTSSWEIQIFLFLFFTMFYVASMLGNILIMLAIISDHHLHSPMYFLLANLSFIDAGVSSIATPKMVYDLFRKHKVISLKGCMTQMFFIHTVGGTEMVLLVVMAYDRYIAICKPLHYLNIMSLRTCISFMAVAWTIGLIHSVAQLAFVVNLPFCGSNQMDSFYCDFPQFIKLACIDTYRLEFLVTANNGFISMGTFFILIVSYIFILVTVRKHSSGGSSKALSTLTAHITVVVFFFGPCIIVYVWPFPTLPIDKFLAIFDVLITSFMNPVICTFRNKDMKVAMRKLFLRALGIRQNSFSPSPKKFRFILTILGN
ncbi:PREDICTED: olfactory receptor 4F3/4F16/4F29-like [Colobus angolensis palliatus]|uniref:olfactory receptor 4F3/4F16/4F29-like n=1 Tax=Colobus angolensis palliatus TaxID=336983 RepID=UPI0005F36664|nr:PREDICTED: olfactory receptor 4F3/4F16/4F29-like [Colobus angolensis palliatus]